MISALFLWGNVQLTGAVQIYTTKIGNLYVCIYGYAFRHAWGIELKVGMGGRGLAQEVCGHIFEATPPGVKGHPEVNLP